MKPLLTITDLHVRYGAYEAVKGVSFTLGKGEILGIVGESGSGKSTIARTLIGLQKASGGALAWGGGHGVSALPRPTMQMIFQDAVGSLNPRMTVRQTLREIIELSNRRIVESSAHSSSRPFADSPIRQFEDSIIHLLSLVGLSTAVLEQYPHELSGGQCQRVSIARALAAHPDILIADEPVSALDVSVQARILNLLRDLRKNLGLSILLIAHDLAVVKNVCDRICVMEKGLFVDEGPAVEVFAHPKSPYTRRLLAAVPDVTRALA